MDRRSFIGFVSGASALAAARALAQEFPSPSGDELYKPTVGQAGKDVIWVPTPDALVTRMLQAAKVTSQDLVYDLGAGDGKIAIAAAKQFGARAVGIEYNPDMAALGKRNAERAGVADKVRIIQGDIFVEDFSTATVVTMYLLPDLNLRLRPTILKMRPGTRVVSHAFHMGEWEPDDTFTVDSREGYLWIVPANAAGRWTFREENGAWEGVADITQRFQRVGGTMTIKGRTQPLLGAYVSGELLGFTFVDADGAVRSVRANIKGDGVDGVLRLARYTSNVKGERR